MYFTVEQNRIGPHPSSPKIKVQKLESESQVIDTVEPFQRVQLGAKGLYNTRIPIFSTYKHDIFRYPQTKVLRTMILNTFTQRLSQYMLSLTMTGYIVSGHYRSPYRSRSTTLPQSSLISERWKTETIGPETKVMVEGSIAIPPLTVIQMKEHRIIGAPSRSKVMLIQPNTM